MSKRTQDIIVGCIVFAGLVLLSASSTQQIAGSLTHQGAVATNPQVGTAMLKPAAWQIDTMPGVGPQLALGMMLILFGLGLHVFFVVRRHSEAQKSPLTIKRAFYIAIGRY